MRNIYSVGRFSRLGLLLLMVVCSLASAWAQDALKPYAVYYDLGDMPTIRQKVFADNGLATRTPGANPVTPLLSWNADATVPEFTFYTAANGKQGNMSYHVAQSSAGFSSNTRSQRAVGGDFIEGSAGWNRQVKFNFTTPWLNPGKYRVYMNAAWDNNNKGNKENKVTAISMDGVAGTPSGSYFFSYNTARRTQGHNKEVLVTNASYTRYDYGAFVGYVEVASAGQHAFAFQLDANGGECNGLMLDMLQFIPVTAADDDADYLWPMFDVGGNAHFEGYDAADVVDNIGDGGSVGKKFYQVADPSVYASAAVAKFALDAEKAVTVYREDKWTRIAEFTTDADGLAIATLPAGNFFWAYDEDLSWTLNAFTMEGADLIIGDQTADFSKFFAQEQTISNGLTDADKVYGYTGMPFSLSSGLGFASVVSSDPTVIAYEDGVLKFLKGGKATVTVTANANDFFSPAQQDFEITVGKSPLTISVGDYDKLLYADMPEFKLTATGLKFDDKAEDLVTISCDAVKESTRGTYPITLTAAASDVYDITVVNGTLTIGRLEQTVTFAQALAGVYGDVIDLTATSSSNLEVAFFSENDAIVKIEGNQAILTGAGTTNIIAYQPGNEDYLPSADVKQAITVGKRTLTVTADASLGVKDAPAPAFTYVYNGFVNGDDESALSVNPEFVTDGVTDGIVTGDITTFDATNNPQNAYAIYMVPTSGISDNYEIAPVNSTFVVIAEKMKQNIEFEPVQPIFGQPVELKAVAWSAGRKSTLVKTNIPVKFEVPDASKKYLKIEGNTVTGLGYGDELSILAIVDGNDIYERDTVEQFVTVSRIPITITANDAERLVFHPEPEFSYTVSGNFLEGDNEQTIRDILADATITTVARFRSKAGRYEINVNGIEGTASYEFIYVPGYNTVKKAETKIIGFGGTTLTVSYGDRVDISAKVVSDFIASTGQYGEVQVPYLTSADSTIATICDPEQYENLSFIIGNGVGTTTVKAYFPGNDYYEAAPEVEATHEVIVVKREITLIANDASRYASQPNPDFTYSAVGLASTYKIDTLEVLFTKPGAVAPVLVTDATENSLRGDSYEIWFDTDAVTPVLPNYDIVAYKAGHLTITGGVQQSISFGAENITRMNTGNKNEFKYKLSGTATSGLTVTYSLLNPSVECAELNGNILTFDTSKQLTNLTIVAHQVGNNYYGAADDVSQDFGLVQFHGTVTDSSTYEPIVGATVRIYREQNMERTPEQIAEDNRTGRITYPASNIYDLVDEVVTDGDGFYNSTYVQGLSRFKIEVISGAGYMNLYYDFRSGARGTTYTWENTITTSEAPILSGSSYLRDFPIPPLPQMKGSASIEGKVFIDECAKFVNSVEDVTLYLLQAVNPKSATPRFTTFYTSLIPTPENNSAWKSAGSYKFNNIPYGKYFLGITYPGGNTSNMSQGFIFSVDSASLDTAYFTRDFLIVDRDAFTQTITAADDDIAASLAEVTVFPNPTSNGIFSIATKAGEYTLTIVNEAQQTVYATKVNSEQFQVNISGQADGLYFVILDFGDKQIVKKVTLLK